MVDVLFIGWPYVGENEVIKRRQPDVFNAKRLVRDIVRARDFKHVAAYVYEDGERLLDFDGQTWSDHRGESFGGFGTPEPDIGPQQVIPNDAFIDSDVFPTAHDHFAAAALSGLIARADTLGPSHYLARDAFDIADACIKLRRQRAEPDPEKEGIT